MAGNFRVLVISIAKDGIIREIEMVKLGTK